MFRQSFKPGEIDPAEASKIVATHTDRSHIHNHVVSNSSNLACTHKFEDFKGLAYAVRCISDGLCLEHGLSVIENPKPSKGKHYGEWLGEEKQPSLRDRLAALIDFHTAERRQKQTPTAT